MKIRQLLYFGTVLMVTCMLIFQPSIIASEQEVSSEIPLQLVDADDQTYHSDTSDAVYHSHTIIPNGTSKITLDPLGSEYSYYNFSDWTENDKDRAYTYNIGYFHPLIMQRSIIMNVFAREINQDLGYGRIASLDGITYPLEQFPEASAKQQVHHFSFKITQDIDSISVLQGIWYGSADNVRRIDLYVWKPATESSTFGIWERVAYTTHTNGTTILSFSFDEELALSTDDFIDFCVVSTPEFSSKGSLFTDFVNVIAKGEGYAPQGTVRSPIIRPGNISYWEVADWTDFQPEKTSIKYKFYYENETGVLKQVENTYLSGNRYGFTSGPIDLRNIPSSYNLSLQMTLKTSDITISPEIYNWGFTWQENSSFWRDDFSTGLRVPKSSQQNVIVRNSYADIVPSIYDWPMFGQNPSNNRANNGVGPGSDHNQLAWYAVDPVGGDHRDPVLKNGRIYIGSDDGTRIFMFDGQAETGGNMPNPKIQQSNRLDYYFVNSPAITADDTLIVATGESQKGGGIENNVICLDENDFSEEWRFEYSSVDSDNPSICYDASPVVTNDRIYLTSWSGDSTIWNTVKELFNVSKGNNKIICLSMNGNYQWSYDLPAGSFSSPAVSDDLIIVCCENLDGSSVFALNKNGKLVWDQDIGPIGRSSPVIYNDRVFIVSKNPPSLSFTTLTNLSALQLSTGTVLWNQTVGDGSADLYKFAGCTTPCVSDDVVFVASPDGYLQAFDVTDGEKLRQDQIYAKGMIGQYLQSSPAFADGYLYVGTPSGDFYCYDDQGNREWKKSAVEYAPIFSSPIVADGLVYYTDSNGLLYAFGELDTPEGMQITGNMISIPIHLPDDENLSWGNFYYSSDEHDGSIMFSVLDVNKNILINNIENESSLYTDKVKNKDSIRLKATFRANTKGVAMLDWWKVTFTTEPVEDETVFYESSYGSSGMPPNCSIDVKNNDVGVNTSSAKFKVEYVDEEGNSQVSSWTEANCTNNDDLQNENLSKRRETISVNLSEHGYTENMTFIEIRFSIKDANGQITYSDPHDFPQQEFDDKAKPVFYPSSFTPVGQYIKSVTPVCTIKAKDQGTEENITGMNVDSARFELRYRDDQGSHTEWFRASCSGVNETKNNVTITADISQINNSENITEVTRIRFEISDMAGNINTSSWFDLEIDDDPPTSSIANKNTLPSTVNTSSIEINVSASDELSGVATVSLYFRRSDQSQWSQFGDVKTQEPYVFDFTIGSADGGEFELVSIATDNAGNEENFPSSADVVFVYDHHNPSKPDFSSMYEYTRDMINPDQIPVFTDIIFADDYLLDSVYYRLNFEGTNQWTKVNDNIINQDTYSPSWNLSQSQWKSMLEDITYYMYFRVVDVLGNTYETPSSAEAMMIKKNFEQETMSGISTDFSDFDEWSFNNEYRIRVDSNMSSVQSITLFYSFSEKKNTTNHSWIQYGEIMRNTSSGSWNFKPENGNGYYSFKIEMVDSQGSLITSDVETQHIQQFPVIELIGLIGLSVVLVIVTILLLQKKKRIIS